MCKCVPLLLLVATALTATARDHAANWIEVRSPRFTIVTDSGEKEGRRIAVQFERMRAVFQQAYPQSEGNSELPIFILAFKNKNQFRALEPASYRGKKSLPLHGMFVRAADRNYILMRLDSQAGNPYPLVYHEYTHLFLSDSDQRMPLWLNEGLAQFYQSTEVHGHDVLLGEPIEQHLMLLREAKLLPLATLFTVDEKSPYYLEEKKGSVFYAECWALTHYLMLRDYAEKTSKLPQYIGLVNDNIDPVVAAVQAFGDLRKLERTLELYVEQRSFDHFETRIRDHVPDSQFDAMPVTAAQAQALESDFLSSSERLEEAGALVRSAAEKDRLLQEMFTPVKREDPAATEFANGTLSDSACPLSEILHGASDRATEMVENLQRFTATEEIEHTEFRRNGKPRTASNQSFSYTAEIDQGPANSFWVEEYRSSGTGGESPALSDTGTAAFALIFHPQKIGNFEFHCEGRTEIEGTQAWQLGFQESADPSKSFHQIRINRAKYQLRFQGSAWIAADTYQILRLQTDLVSPIPEIQLQREHLEISYAPVEFEKQKFTVWLPQSASMQISYRGHRYQRVHRFKRFQLFLVVTQETVKEPKPGPGG